MPRKVNRSRNHGQGLVDARDVPAEMLKSYCSIPQVASLDTTSSACSSARMRTKSQGVASSAGPEGRPDCDAIPIVGSGIDASLTTPATCSNRPCSFCNALTLARSSRFSASTVSARRSDRKSAGDAGSCTASGWLAPWPVARAAGAAACSVCAIRCTSAALRTASRRMLGASLHPLPNAVLGPLEAVGETLQVVCPPLADRQFEGFILVLPPMFTRDRIAPLGGPQRDTGDASLDDMDSTNDCRAYRVAYWRYRMDGLVYSAFLLG